MIGTESTVALMCLRKGSDHDLLGRYVGDDLVFRKVPMYAGSNLQCVHQIF